MHAMQRRDLLRFAAVPLCGPSLAGLFMQQYRANAGERHKLVR